MSISEASTDISHPHLEISRFTASGGATISPAAKCFAVHDASLAGVSLGNITGFTAGGSFLNSFDGVFAVPGSKLSASAYIIRILYSYSGSRDRISQRSSVSCYFMSPSGSPEISMNFLSLITGSDSSADMRTSGE